MSTESKTTDQSGFLYYLVDWPINTLSDLIGIEPLVLTEFSFLFGGVSLLIKLLFAIIDITLPEIINFPLNILILFAIPSVIYLWRNSHIICDSLVSILGGAGVGTVSWLLNKITFGFFSLETFLKQKICGDNADTAEQTKTKLVAEKTGEVLTDQKATYEEIVRDSQIRDSQGRTFWQRLRDFFTKGPSSLIDDTTDTNTDLSDAASDFRSRVNDAFGIKNTTKDQTITSSFMCFRKFHDDTGKFTGFRRGFNDNGDVIEIDDESCNTSEDDISNQSDYDAYLAKINQSASNCNVPAPHEDNTDSNGSSYNEPVTPKHHYDPAGKNPSKKKWCTDPKNRGEAAHDPDCHWYKKGTGDSHKEWNKKLNDHMDNSDKDTSVKNIPKGKRGMMK